MMTMPDEPPTHAPSHDVAKLGRVSAFLAGVLLGAMVGVVGTVFHRTSWGPVPLGVLASLTLVVTGVVFMRALDGRLAAAVFALAALAGIAVLAVVTPGGDRILLADGPGLSWAGGAVVLAGAGLALPSRWIE